MLVEEIILVHHFESMQKHKNNLIDPNQISVQSRNNNPIRLRSVVYVYILIISDYHRQLQILLNNYRISAEYVNLVLANIISIYSVFSRLSFKILLRYFI